MSQQKSLRSKNTQLIGRHHQHHWFCTETTWLARSNQHQYLHRVFFTHSSYNIIFLTKLATSQYCPAVFARFLGTKTTYSNNS